MIIFSTLIFLKSFLLNTWNSWSSHHGFYLLTGLYFSFLQLLPICKSVCHWSYLWWVRSMLSWVYIKKVTFSFRQIPFHCFSTYSIFIVNCHSNTAFDSEFSLTVTFSINTNDPVVLTAMSVHFFNSASVVSDRSLNLNPFKAFVWLFAVHHSGLSSS